MNEFGTIHGWQPSCHGSWHTWRMDQIDEPAERSHVEMIDSSGPGLAAENSPTVSAGWAWLAGTLGAAVALGVGEFASRLSEQIMSLVIGVGELFVDITPGEVVATSINNVGAAQKPILLWSIVIGSLLVGGAIGLGARRDQRVIPAGFALFGVFGGFATARSSLTNGPLSWLVALTAAAAGAATVMVLFSYARRASTPSPKNVIVPGSPLSQAANRRRILAYGGAAVGAVALTTGSRIGRTSTAERARDEILTNASSSFTTLPPGGSAIVQPNALPTGAFDDVAGLTSYITPISPDDEFYLIDTALQKPQVDPSTWSLTIDGEYVTTPVTYTYDELMAREMIETEVTLSCVSNPVGGDLVGNAVWRGIPLAELFAEAGIIDPTDAQTQVFSRSVDGFTCGFPTPLAYDGRTAMLALEMNGEPLPIIHGFPARIVVAGLYGYVSATKWVERISITDWIGVDGFWMPRGWSKEGPIKTQSRIDVPQNRDTVSPGLVNIGGVAWSPTVGIERVEISLGEDEVWQEVELAVVESNETWVQWKFDWDATPGDWFIRVRATDTSGFTQSPITVAPAPNGAEGYHTILVQVQ
jgi:DMSO/TMAO reductase YedYZ molybdopterin-dependent catalytic subunit